MEETVHKKRLDKALNEKKIIILQYSCTDFRKPPVIATSFFGIDYYTDEEFAIDKTDPDFKIKIKRYFENHRDYYFCLWNFNSTYSYKNLDLTISESNIKKLGLRTIDLDSAFEEYVLLKNIKYIKKQGNGFDKRYYFALLNGIEISRGWIWGKHEAKITNYVALLQSSRLKAKITLKLLDKYRNGVLKLSENKKIVQKSKRIIGIIGWLNYYWTYKRDIALILLSIMGTILLSIISNYVSHWLF